MEWIIHHLIILYLHMAVQLTSGCRVGCRTQAKTFTCCEITSFPATMASEIEVVQILDSSIPAIKRNQFSKLPNIKRVLLRNCMVETISSFSFSYLSQVKVNISESNIDTIEPFAFTGLSRLDLNIENSTIFRIRSKSFSDIQTGTWFLRHVNITEIEHAAVFNVSRVKKMLVYASFIHKLRPEALSEVCVDRITIYNNSVDHGCHTVVQLKALTRKFVFLKNKVNCECCLNDTLGNSSPKRTDCDKESSVATTPTKPDITDQYTSVNVTSTADINLSTSKAPPVSANATYFTLPINVTSEKDMNLSTTNELPVSTNTTYFSLPPNITSAGDINLSTSKEHPMSANATYFTLPANVTSEADMNHSKGKEFSMPTTPKEHAVSTNSVYSQTLNSTSVNTKVLSSSQMSPPEAKMISPSRNLTETKNYSSPVSVTSFTNTTFSSEEVLSTGHNSSIENTETFDKNTVLSPGGGEVFGESSSSTTVPGTMTTIPSGKSTRPATGVRWTQENSRNSTTSVRDARRASICQTKRTGLVLIPCNNTINVGETTESTASTLQTSISDLGMFFYTGALFVMYWRSELC